MSGRRETNEARGQLLEMIASVRRRWRGKVLLRGLLITSAAALVAFAAAAWGLERLNFAESAVVAFRIAAVLAILALAVLYLVRPLRRRVRDEQVALYIEEHEPSLQNTLISALESDSVAASPAFARRTIEQAIERCREIDHGRRVDRRELNRFATAFAAVAIAGIVLTGFGPPLFRHGAGALLNPFGRAADANPYRITVVPGDATIARGADQVVTATLIGWESRAGSSGMAQQIEILIRAAGDSVFQRIPLTPTENSAEYEVLLFDVGQPTEYYIEADGIRSPLHRIDVADLPFVERLQLEYDYPDYTGLPNEIVEDGGDIIALRGTLVTVRAVTTMPVAGARIVIEDGRGVLMHPGTDGVLEGAFRVSGPGFYSITLTTADSMTVPGSARYLIDVLDDRGPSVRLSKPGHDIRPTVVEEVFVEASAEDDFGVAKLELVYSVNGGEERSIPLVRGGRPLPEISAGHTFYLEELDLRPGDLIAYHARATDNSGANGRVATSDIFFMNVRPFGRDYRQAEQAGGGGGGGEGGERPGELSQRQRDIITATFNLIRDSAQYQQREYAENLNTIALMQDRLREQVATLRTRMDNRQITQDSMFARIAAILPLATAEMEVALEELRRTRTRDALGAEQRALQQLQRAESLFRDVQVAFDQQQGGGGGGGGAPNAEDLADLFELERDKLRNQYETIRRGEQQQSQNQGEVDAALERLRELARRQEQENERLRQQAASRQNQQGGGGSAQSQRQLADETEQAARQLERLSRETQQPQLNEVARQLQQAADQMRRSAANARSGNTADANSALSNLEDARRRLERTRSASLEQEARAALERAERLAREQREIAQGMNRLPNTSGSEQQNEARRLIERKEEQVREVADLERQLDRLAAGTRAEQRDASRRLQEAANSIRDNQLKERISYSRQFAYAGGNDEFGRAMEQNIGESLEELRERLQQANTAVAENPQQRTEEALDRLRRLARGLESLQERTRAAAESENTPGNTGSPQQNQQAGSEQGQQGQQGHQGQLGGGGPGGRLNAGGGGATGAAGPRGIAADDARQLRGEARQRLTEAQSLRQQLAREGRGVAELDEVIRGLRTLEGGAPWGDAQDLERLQAAIVDRLKQYEFGLRRDVLGADRDRLFLSGSDEVPESYRRLVEEYYRSLARERRQ
jgi:hypothetical protein